MRIFISYAREDMLLCDALARELESLPEVDVERDLTSVGIGSVPDLVREQVESCDLLVVLLTQHGISSAWVVTEVTWAAQTERPILPVVEAGIDLARIPALKGDLHHIPFDPARYMSALCQARDFVGGLRKRSAAPSRSEEPAGVAETVRMGIDSLGSEDIQRLLSLKSVDIAPLLEERLADQARNTVYDFFTDPKYGSFVNVGTLSTDSKVIIMRWDTLHALLRAARKGSKASFRRAGYEAGVLYGIGIVRWLLDKSKEVRRRPGLPTDSWELMGILARIDVASGWGQIDISRSADTDKGIGWLGAVSIRDHFLAHELNETRTKGSEGRCSAYAAFWQGYIEGGLSTSLIAWHGLWRTEGTEVPLLAATASETQCGTTPDILLDLHVGPPLYEGAYIDVQREMLLPYLRGDTTRMAARARSVVEGLVRELAGAEDDPREDMEGALTWLGREVQAEGREATAGLQRARNDLHKVVHGTGDPSKEESRYILRTAVSAVLMASSDVRMDERVSAQLREILAQRT